MNKENIESIVPLLPMQQSFLWHSLNTRSGSGVIQLRCTLTGTIDTEKLQAAWDTVVSRHQALRSTVHWKAVSKPVQVVHKRLHSRITFVHGSTDTPLDHHLEADRNTALDLTQAPAYRLTIFQNHENSCQIVWALSHVILDGWSCVLIINDWVAHYSALLDNTSLSAQPSPPINQYTRWMTHQNQDDLMHFWNSYLPDDQGRHATQEPASYLVNTELPVTDSVSTSLGADVFGKLQDCLRQSGLGLGTLMQGALAVAIKPRWSDDPVLFSTTVSGRHIDLPDTEARVGMLINVMPICVSFQEAATVLDWLKGIQTRFFSSLPSSHVNVSDIQTGRSDRRSPFDTLLVLENQPSVISTDKVLVNDFKSGIISDLANTLVVIPGHDLCLEWQQRGSHVDKTGMALTLQRIVTLLEQIPTLLDEPLSVLDRFIPDDAALPATESITRATHQKYSTDSCNSDLSPVRALERRLTDIWCDVLNRHKIDCNTDFFELGGTSFQAIEMFDKIEQQLGVRLPATSLFDSPTVTKISALIESDQPGSWLTSVIEVNRNGSKPPLIIPFEQTDMLMYRHLCRELGPDQPVYGIKYALDLPLTPEAPSDRAEELLAHIKRVQPQGPYLLAGLSGAGFIAWEIAQKLQQENQSVAMLALLDTYGPAYPQLLPPVHRCLSVARFLVELILQVLRRRIDGHWRKYRPQTNSRMPPVNSEIGNITPTPTQSNSDFKKRVDQDRQSARNFVFEVSKSKHRVTQWLNYVVLRMTTWRVRTYTPHMALIVFTQGLLLEYCREQLTRPGGKPINNVDLHTCMLDGSLAIDDSMPATRLQLHRYQRMYRPLKPYTGNVLYCQASRRPPGVAADNLAGWNTLLLQTPNIQTIPGSHTSLLKYPHVKVLARALSNEMEHAIKPPRGS